MSIRKVKSSRHGINRFKQRVQKKYPQRTIKLASKYGKSPNYFVGEFRKYLENKASARNKRIKVYENCIYVFPKTSNRLITVYPIPINFMEKGEK